MEFEDSLRPFAAALLVKLKHSMHYIDAGREPSVNQPFTSQPGTRGPVDLAWCRVFLLSIDPAGNWARGALTAGLETSLDHGLVPRASDQRSILGILHLTVIHPTSHAVHFASALIRSYIMWVGIAIGASVPRHPARAFSCSLQGNSSTS